MLSKFKSDLSEILKPLTESLIKSGVRPNHLTLAGLMLGFLSSILIVEGFILPASLLLILSAFMDALDGALARNENLKTEFGGFLDSVADRYVDVAIILSAGIYSGQILLSSIAMAGALLVSYTRARAEHIIDRCDVGIAERGERTIILILGLITGFVWQALLIIAILSHFTAIHRIYYTYTQTR